METVECVGIRNGRFVIRANEAVLIGGITEGPPLFHISTEHILKIELLDRGRKSLQVFELTGPRKQAVKVCRHLKRAGWIMAATGAIGTVGLLIATPFYPPAACFVNKTIKMTLVGAGIGIGSHIAGNILSRVKYVKISVKTKSGKDLPAYASELADLQFITRMPEQEYQAFLARMQTDDDTDPETEKPTGTEK